MHFTSFGSQPTVTYDKTIFTIPNLYNMRGTQYIDSVRLNGHMVTKLSNLNPPKLLASSSPTNFPFFKSYFLFQLYHMLYVLHVTNDINLRLVALSQHRLQNY